MITEKVRKAALLEREYFLQKLMQRELDLKSTNRPAYCKTKNFRAASRSLLRKRIRTVAGVLPHVRESLGDEFESLFRKFAKEQHLIATESPTLDAVNFSKWLLLQRKDFSDSAVIEMMSINLHHRVHDERPLAQFALELGMLKQSKRCAVGVSAPVVGSRIFVL